MKTIKQILEGKDKALKKALFLFNKENNYKEIIFKFNLWSRYFFANYFTSDDAPFHKEMDLNNLKAYYGEIDSFTNIVFRGGGKTARTKLFVAFFIANDEDHTRKYIKVLSSDGKNSKQIATDIYNMLITVKELYPEIFEKTITKREETMTSFTTTTGVKLVAGTVGTEQRGSLQEDSRPDYQWCHEKGTKILDKNTNNEWINVEEHKTFTKYREEIGIEVKLFSLYKTEIVTNEHRYWIKRKQGKELTDQADWVEAQKLKKGDYIGYKIDKETKNNFPKLKKYIGGKIVERDKKGKIIKSVNGFEMVDVPEFKDKEWWWFFGLFWGDGNLASSQEIAVTIADKDKYIFNRVVRLLNKYNIKYQTSPYVGCFRLQFSHAVLRRWLKTWYKGGNSQKVPPVFVEKIDIDFQKELIHGYIDADGYIAKNEVKITSVSINGLYTARRILARIGIPSSIRLNNIARKNVIICGKKCNTQEKYDLRFRENAKELGYDIKNQTRYRYTETFIKDGFLWSKVLWIKETKNKHLFCPIQTETEDYQTNFGLSHNCEDFESRKTIRSSVITKSIWDNMEEARTGGAKGSPCIYTCNYISEAGNVHKLVNKEDKKNIVTNIPIIKDDVITWNRYTKEDIEQMKKYDDDFEGERLGNPSAGKDIYFDRQKLEKMEIKTPIRISAEFKIFHEFVPGHRYGSGHDVAGGIGLDSSTSVFIDFSTVPARVVGTFASNTIKPEAFGHEVYREQEMFGGCISAIENNFGTDAILILKQKNANLFTTKARSDIIEEREETRYGWNTNALSKGNMLQALFSALEDGLLELSDKELIQEAKSYTRHDSIENVKDPRLTTRHFDLLMALAIAWQMKDYATEPNNKFKRLMETNEETYVENEYE